MWTQPFPQPTAYCKVSHMFCSTARTSCKIKTKETNNGITTCMWCSHSVLVCMWCSHSVLVCMWCSHSVLVCMWCSHSVLVCMWCSHSVLVCMWCSHSVPVRIMVSFPKTQKNFLAYDTFFHDHYSTTQDINAVYMDSLTHAVLFSVQILSVLKEKVAGSLALIPVASSSRVYPTPPRSTPPIPPCRIVYADFCTN